MSVMTGTLSSEGTSDDATATKRLAERRHWRDAGSLSTGASGAATNVVRGAGAAARCGSAAQRAGAAARARALLQLLRRATAGNAAVNAIAAPHAFERKAAETMRCDAG